MTRLLTSRSLLTTLPAALALLGLVLLLVVTGQIAPASPVHAQTSTVLVSNFSQTALTTATTTYDTGNNNEAVVSAWFTTGSGAPAYTLTSIEVKTHSNQTAVTSGAIKAELWSAATSMNNPPGAKVYDLTVPSVSASANTVAFTAPSGATMAPSAQYYLVVYTTDTTAFQMQQTASDSEDGTPGAGWSIQDGNAYFALGSSPGSWERNVGGNAGNTALIQVKGTEATSYALVSNFVQTAVSAATSTYGTYVQDGSQERVLATQFTTGSGADSYTLSSIAVKTPAGQVASSGKVVAELWSAAASTNNPPDAKVHDLVEPDVSAGANTVTFTAPPGATMEPSTQYYLVVYTTDTTVFQMQQTASDDEDGTPAAGWSIEDGQAHYMSARSPDQGSWARMSAGGAGANTALIQVNGQAVVDPLDLSALTGATSTDGVTFNDMTGADAMAPAFAPNTTTYRATVGNDVTHVQLTPTLADTSSSVKVGKASGALTTVVSGSASAAIALDVGDNHITVEVTDTDGNADTYTVTVRRVPVGTEWHATLVPEAYSGQGGGVGCTDDSECASQLTDASFTVDSTSYEIAEARDHIGSGGFFQVSFTTEPGTALQALKFCDGDTAYSIAAGTPAVIASGTDVGWAEADPVSLSVGVSCVELSTNANLSALTAESSPDGNTYSALSLSPSFDSAATRYTTATVPYSTTVVRLTPTVEDTGKATMSYLQGSTPIAPGGSADVSLKAGLNEITIRVTASAGTIKDYTVVVTRESVLDLSFSSASTLTTAVGSAGDRGHAMAIQSDGKVVVAGYSNNGSNNDFAVVRYNTDGTLDPTFGTGGKVTTAIGSDDDEARALAIDGDGNIVVVGNVRLAQSGNDFAMGVARYTAAGALDTTFDTDGKLTLDFSSTHGDYAHGVALQSDGKIVVAGRVFVSGEDFNFAVARFNADGTLDTDFDTDGKADYSLNNNGQWGEAVAVQPDGKILVAGSSWIPAAGGTPAQDFDFAVARLTAAGDLDTTFSGDGWDTRGLGANSANGQWAEAMALQSDGKIVLAGRAWVPGENWNFAVARLTTTGALDTTFNSSGYRITPVGSGADQAYAVAMQSDGKIVVGGYSYNGTDQDFAVLRYDTDGSLDTDFGSGGKVTTAIGTGNDEAHAMTLDSGGNILLAGFSVGSTDDFALAAYTPDGEPAAILDGPGWLTTTIGSGADEANAVAIQSDGKIVVAGYSYNGSNDDFAVARYTTAGRLDTTFGTDHDTNGAPDGYVTTAIGSGQDRANAVAIQSDGKIVVAGYSHNGSENDFALARYTTVGTLDTDFGTGGKVTTDFDEEDDVANAMVIQSNGKIVVAGSTVADDERDFLVARYTADGTLDTDFSLNGWQSYNFYGDGDGHDSALAVAVDSRGRIVLVGQSPTDIIVGRLTAGQFAGDTDNSFGSLGYVTTSLGSGSDRAYAVAIQPDDKIVVAGFSSNGNDFDFAWSATPLPGSWTPPSVPTTTPAATPTAMSPPTSSPAEMKRGLWPSRPTAR